MTVWAAVVPEAGASPTPERREVPRPGEGQSLVEVHAAALNPVELRVAAGRMGSLQTPYVPGLEGAGVVLESASLARGTRVRFEGHLPGFGRDGVISEQTVVDDEAMTALPDDVADEEAAAVGVVGITAWLSLDRAGMEPGQRVVVLGATGGVGQMAVQLARHRRAGSVVAVGRHLRTLERLMERGADAFVILAEKNDQDLAAEIRSAARGDVDLVIDTLWGEPGMAAVAALGAEGRLVNVGNAAGTEVELPLAAMRQARSAVIGLSSGWTPLPVKLDAYRRVLETLRQGALQVDLEVFPLEGIAEAWRLQAASPHRKLLIGLGGELLEVD